MNKSMKFAISGFVTAVAVTTAMDATGYANFSALALLPIGLVFCWLQGCSRADVGIVRSDRDFYFAALLMPVTVLLLVAAVSVAAGAVDTADANWRLVLINVVAGSTIGIPMVVLTEEGFFRGWLWTALARAGLSSHAVLLATTFAFVAWHLSAVLLDTGFDLPLAEVPIYLVNATLLGLTWGLLREASGSIVVASICHAVWNAIAYPFYGFGEKVGALGIQATHVFGPEVGYLGILINSLALVALWWWIRGRDGEGFPQR